MDALHGYLKAERGRAFALATSLGISPSAISQWQRVPVERVIEIERLTGISRHELRPDIYPASEQESAA
jgi:DNA-binding transcriptional regulator YdaS (Cro superfamily)